MIFDNKVWPSTLAFRLETWAGGEGLSGRLCRGWRRFWGTTPEQCRWRRGWWFQNRRQDPPRRSLTCSDGGSRELGIQRVALHQCLAPLQQRGLLGFERVG